MLKNAHLYNLQTKYSQSIAAHKPPTSNHAGSSTPIPLKEISDIFKYHDHKEAATLTLSDPLIFTLLKKNDVDKDTYVAVLVGDTDDIKTLRTIRYDGTAKNAEKPLEKPYGVFSGYGLYPEDRHFLEDKEDRPGLVNRSKNIVDVKLEQFAALDIARIFEGLAVLDEQNHFKGTLLKTTQLKDFVDKFPKVGAVLKLAEMYQKNHSSDDTGNFYVNLLNSIKLLNQYQAITDKPAEMSETKLDDEMNTLARFLPASPMKTEDVIVRNADDEAAYKVISAAKDLCEQLKLKLVSTDAQVAAAVQSYKSSKLEAK